MRGSVHFALRGLSDGFGGQVCGLSRQQFEFDGIRQANGTNASDNRGLGQNGLVDGFGRRAKPGQKLATAQDADYDQATIGKVHPNRTSAILVGLLRQSVELVQLSGGEYFFKFHDGSFKNFFKVLLCGVFILETVLTGFRIRFFVRGIHGFIHQFGRGSDPLVTGRGYDLQHGGLGIIW
jgi:hypothetical protein